MAMDLFAGVPVTNYAAALPWYERFFGGPPSFLPNDTEAVWEVAEHRYIYIVQNPGRAGNALVLSSSTTSTSGSPASPDGASNRPDARCPPRA
ncbi:MAG TPA: hypothetical protein VJ254_06745 [Streptosporangiaceae bacterium]|nr:hypothetical protein [Streptosporangiaceae bacterium]